MTTTRGFVRKFAHSRAPDIKIHGSITKKLAFHGSTPVAQQAGSAQAATGPAAPAGGTGATAGAYDTASNRNLMIVLVNETRTLVNELRQDLVDLGLIKGAS